MALRADGSVAYNGKGDYKSENPNQWTDVLAIALGEDHVVCLKTDGSVVSFAGDRNIELPKGWHLGTTPLEVDESLAQAVAESEAVLPEKQLSQNTYGAYGQGFAGPVWVEVSFDEEGGIGYFTIGDEKFCETEGFGRKVQWPDFMDQFYGLKAPLSLADIDAVSGATTSSRAVVEGINKAYEQWLQATGKTVETVKGSAKGLIGLVNVEVAFDEHGKILFLIVDASQETEAFGSQVEKSSFRDQFLGMKAPVDMADVDAVSGATYSSKAVAEGINNAYLLWLQANGKAAETVPAQEEAAQPDAMAVKSWSASEKGFSGPVKVDVVFDAEGKIKSLSVAAENETPGFGKNVEESSFQDQFIGMKAPVNIADVDVASHATISSTAAVNAINKAYELYLQSK